MYLSLENPPTKAKKIWGILHFCFVPRKKGRKKTNVLKDVIIGDETINGKESVDIL